MRAETNYTTDYDKRSLLHAVSAVGIANFFIFGLINYRTGDYTSAYFEWGLLSVALLNLLYLRRTHNTQLASTIALLLITIALTYLLITGGIAGTGILWFYSFPALAFFLQGKRIGWAWFAGLMVIFGIVLLLQMGGYLTQIYSLTILRQLVASLLTVAILIYFYQSIIEHHQGLLHKSLEEIKKQNLFLEKAAAISEEKAKDDAFLSCIGEGVVITDQSSQVIRVNTAAEEMVGYSAEELQGKRWAIDGPHIENEKGEPIPVEKHALSRVIARGKKITDTYYYVRKDGSRFPTVVTAALVVMGSMVIGAILVFRDITQEKAADQAKSEFISLASHQLRTPLSEVRWYIESLQHPDAKHPLTAAEEKKYLRRIQDANLRMIDLVNDLLNISSIEMGTFTFHPKPVEVQEVIDTVITELQPQMTDKKVTIKAKLDSDLKKITTDRTLLYILLQNLLSNAVKYSRDGGSVEVTVRPEEADSTIALLTVADSGYGIRADQQGQVFTKLFRGENVSSKGIGGTGLGLYVVKSIVEFLKGSITFTSQEDQGTTFYVKLPLTNSPANESHGS